MNILIQVKFRVTDQAILDPDKEPYCGATACKHSVSVQHY